MNFHLAPRIPLISLFDVNLGTNSGAKTLTISLRLNPANPEFDWYLMSTQQIEIRSRSMGFKELGVIYHSCNPPVTLL
jgi:hypothetical protein